MEISEKELKITVLEISLLEQWKHLTFMLELVQKRTVAWGKPMPEINMAENCHDTEKFACALP